MRYILTFVILSTFWACQETKEKETAHNQTKTYNADLSACTPEEQGMNSTELVKMLDYVRNEKINVNSIVIVRNGKTVLDAHFYPNRKEYIHDVASVTKTITSAIVGIAIDKGFIKNENQKVSEFFPEFKNNFDTDWKKALTIKDLLTMSSGICTNFGDGENQLDEMRLVDNSVEYILNKKLVSKPGTQFAYCSIATQLLSIIITKTTGSKMEVFGKEHLLDPLGITNYIFTEDKSGFTNGWGDSYWLTSDLAKIGQLYLNRGKWYGKEIISEKWIEISTKEQISLGNGAESYGYKWWIPNEIVGLYEGRGRGEQRLVVYPKENLVVVMTGTGFDSGELGGFIINSIESKNPLAINKEKMQILKNKLFEIQKPETIEQDVEIPISINQISERKFIFEENSFGLTNFSIKEKSKNEYSLMIDLNIHRSNEYGEREIPLSFDGRYIISKNTRFKTPMASKAKWINDQHIIIDYNDFSSNHKYIINIEFMEDKAEWTMEDVAGFGDVLELKATAE